MWCCLSKRLNLVRPRLAFSPIGANDASDRLGRNIKQLIDIVDDLRVRDGWIQGASWQRGQIDTTTSNGRLCFGIFAALAELKGSSSPSARARLAAAARARGRRGGRPRKMDAAMLKMTMTAMADPSVVATDVAKRLAITTTILYTYNCSSFVMTPISHLAAANSTGGLNGYLWGAIAESLCV